MNIGHLRHKITLERRSVTRTDIGSEVISWVKVTDIKASAVSVGGSEAFKYKQLFAESVVRFTCRYRSDIVPEMRIVFDGQYYDIFDISDIEGRKRALEIMGKQGLTNG